MTGDGSYTVRCDFCGLLLRDGWTMARLTANWHEQGEHRVQVYPTDPIAAPLPRELWVLS